MAEFERIAGDLMLWSVFPYDDPETRRKKADALQRQYAENPDFQRFEAYTEQAVEAMRGKPPRPIRIVPEPEGTLPENAPAMFAGIARILCGGCEKCEG